jgi:hypothetical protein
MRMIALTCHQRRDHQANHDKQQGGKFFHAATL